jgi:hypothetical protein
MTVVAVGFLALDGALLLLAGIWSGRVGLVLLGSAFAACAVGVVFYWRRYLRQLRALGLGLEARFQDLQELDADSRRE